LNTEKECTVDDASLTGKLESSEENSNVCSTEEESKRKKQKVMMETIIIDESKRNDSRDARDLIVKSTSKKKTVSAKTKQAPAMRRPTKSKPNASGVVVQGVRTYYMNKKRVRNGKKLLIHYVSEKEEKKYIEIPHITNMTSCEQIALISENHPLKTMTLYVDQKPESQDYTKNVTAHEPLKRQALKYNIALGESISVNKNDTCIIMNVGSGATVWCMDWCHSDLESTQYAVFGCHPHHRPFNRVNEFYVPDTKTNEPMDNMLQIWSFGGYVTEKNTDNKDPIRCVTCIKHNHGFAWDCKWMPNYAKCDADVNILGVLAVAFSDGTLVIYTVPKLDEPSLGKVNCITLEETQVYTEADTINGRKLFTALGWSVDCRYLVVGCADGHLVIWKVNRKPMENQKLLTKIGHVRGHFHHRRGGRVRSICWSTVNINVFATCGDDGSIRYWDIRNIFEPDCANAISTCWVTDICYPLNTNGAISVGNDGQIRQFDSKENVFANLRQHQYPLWSISIMSTRAAFSYCGSDGTVMISSLEEDSAVKARTTAKDRIEYALCTSAVVKEGDEVEHSESKPNENKYICLSFPFNTNQEITDQTVTVTDISEQKKQEYAGPPIMEEQTKKSSKRTINKGIHTIPDYLRSLFSVRYHHSRQKGLRNWCIFGGQAGYVCALQVPDSF
jgi:WD40 repeat protein